MKSHNGGHEQVQTRLITGITGQDGNYLTELLLDKGYGTWDQASS